MPKLGHFRTGSPNQANSGVSRTAPFGTCVVSEVILADEDTRHFVGVASLAPSAAGDTNTWDSGAYTDIDEAVLDDADMLKSGTAAQDFNCNLNDLPAGDFDIGGVKVTARAVRGV